jgi:ERCC4-type nuclease
LTEKKIVYSAITSLNYFKGFSVMRTATVRESAELLVWMTNKIDRDFVKGKIPAYLINPVLPKNEREPVILETIETLETLENVVIEENGPEKTQQEVTAPNSSGGLRSPTELVIGGVNAPWPNYCTVVKKVKKDNITPENIGEIILCQIPGISSVTAMAIMKKFTSFPHFLEEMKKSTEVLENLVCENNGKSRKISKACVENIKRFLLSDIATPVL